MGTRAAIVRGAAEAFRRRGYGGTTLSDVEAATGVTKGALYFHFDSKESLALAVIEAQHESSIALGQRLLGGATPGLRALVTMSFELARQVRFDPVVAAGIRLTMESSNLSVPVTGPYEDWIAVCDALLRQGIVDGDVSVDVDVAAAAHFISPAFTGVQIVSEVLTGREDLFQRVEEMWMLLLPALVPAGRRDDLRRLPAEVRRAVPEGAGAWSGGPEGSGAGARRAQG
ncbi:MAG: TetR/AcrR family transcriptional regulator [Ramlibacter sp.]|nr:TetR/AcrR family transcriptional regulator [Cryobacterium sp.]